MKLRRIDDKKEIEEKRQEGLFESELRYLDDNDVLCYVEEENDIVAIIRMSEDVEESNSVWIDEFEVLKKYRGQGKGKFIIVQFIKRHNWRVRLCAKNKMVAKFWKKCGFKEENEGDIEIYMYWEGKDELKTESSHRPYEIR